MNTRVMSTKHNKEGGEANGSEKESEPWTGLAGQQHQQVKTVGEGGRLCPHK
jgi:hypothetical protein